MGLLLNLWESNLVDYKLQTCSLLNAEKLSSEINAKVGYVKISIFSKKFTFDFFWYLKLI